MKEEYLLEFFDKKDKSIIEFYNYINLKNFTYNTKINYLRELYSVFCYFNKDLKLLDKKNIKSYLNYLYTKNMASSSISKAISVLKSYYKYLNKLGITNNPMINISYPKKENKLPKFIEYNELNKMLNYFNKHSSIKERLIIYLFYDTGMRLSELSSIEISNIDKSKLQIKTLGKGNKERIVYITPGTLEILNEYMNTERVKLLKSKTNNYLILNNFGGKISNEGVRNIIESAFKNMGSKTHVNPHMLRHTFATHMLNEGCDIRVVQELLGHENLNTTIIYTHVSNEKLRQVYNDSHPRS